MTTKRLLLAFLALVVLLAACTGPTTNEPLIGHAASDEPTLAITGDELADETVLDATDTDDNSTETDTTDAELPTKTVKEGDLVSFDNLAATDPDGDTITFTFSEPLDDEGTWQTERGDAGTYVVTITASDGENEVTQDVRVVVESINTAPELELASDEITVNEGEEVVIVASAADADGDDVEISFSGWMTSKSKDTTSEDAGEHEVTVTASDGTESVEKTVTVIVNDVNHAPDLSSLEDVSVTEGDTVTLVPDATDEDDDVLTFTFSDPLDEEGIWETDDGDAGKYTVRVTVSDGDLNDTRSVDVTVVSRNKPPVLDLDDDTITVDEGETVTIEFDVSDPDEDDVTVSFSGWMDSDSYTTGFDDAGTHTVTVTAEDGVNSVSEDVTVTVREVNRPPVFDKSAFS